MIVNDYHVVGSECYFLPSDEPIKWLVEKFGNPGTRWFYRLNCIYFLNETDHLMFLLRWS